MRDTREAVNQLCSRLEESTKIKRNGKCKKFTNFVHNTKIAIDSWKFQDFDYGKEDVNLPVQARGFFTLNNEAIVVRGYDKFFNVGEKPFTKEKYLLEKTKGPYDVTLKENGCIIFISGLSSGDIVVCSKHSTGQREGTERNHALEGEMQLRKQLGDEGVKQLAQYLYSHNLTAIAELCDDEFEEHVLAYPRDKAGLYLHGLNYNSIKFQTLAISEVVEFAREWGFKVIDYLQIEDANELFRFLHECGKTGTYRGREIEGFVMRCKMNQDDDFFFKYKFEEPYLLYRQFREGTRQLLNGSPILSIKMKKNKFITKKYLEFAAKLFEEQPDLKERYRRGFGIIHVRQLFLEHLQETNGMNLLSLDAKLSEEMGKLSIMSMSSSSSSSPEETIKYVFVPIATIGCGKTTVFNTLSLLFPDWVHIQNDNISRKSKLKITDQTLKALEVHSVVLFDRNNSLYRERKQIFTTVAEKRKQHLDDFIDIKFIGLNFVHDISEQQLWDITFERVEKRGDNHQSIKSNKDKELATKVMQGFIDRFQPVNTEKQPDCQFDHVINLKLTKSDSSLENVEIIINDIMENFPKLIPTKPSEEVIEEMFKTSLEYKPTFFKDMTVKKPKKPLYYGIGIHYEHIIECLELIAENEEYLRLQKEKFVQDEFHITLGHVSNTKTNNKAKAKWTKLVETLGLGDTEAGKNYLSFFSNVRLLQVVINKGKLICIKCELLLTTDANKTKVDIDPINEHLHITVGCFPPTTAVDSNATLQALYKDSKELKRDGVYDLDNDTIEVRNFQAAIPLTHQQIFAFF
ncbi:trl1 [Candida oxycetoniae]|uniref:tRNA ligase n=1 Tax=Candida oxycetoniae TaxID=497107 RepID=A0AAI9SXY2_9ASCO|nr:trl1 [Candida oxycetoniae]KAI3405129.2 trl1 [Candida oxycetoniae]